MLVYSLHFISTFSSISGEPASLYVTIKDISFLSLFLKRADIFICSYIVIIQHICERLFLENVSDDRICWQQSSAEVYWPFNAVSVVMEIRFSSRFICSAFLLWIPYHFKLVLDKLLYPLNKNTNLDQLSMFSPIRFLKNLGVGQCQIFQGCTLPIHPDFLKKKKKKKKKTKKQNPEREVQGGGDICISTADSC